MPNKPYQIQWSTDLVTWQTIETLSSVARFFSQNHSPLLRAAFFPYDTALAPQVEDRLRAVARHQLKLPDP
jgi:hypothetical protein